MADEQQNNGQQNGQSGNGEQQQQQAVANPLDENNWKEVDPAALALQQKQTDQNNQQQQQQKQEDIFDENEWIKNEWGWENKEVAKTEIEKLKAKPEPQPQKYANETSERIAKSLLEGKDEDVYNFLTGRKKIERAEKLDPSKVEEATELIRLHYELQPHNLTANEINRLITRAYTVPKKPEQLLEQTDADYQVSLQDWQERVAEVQQDIVIQAKLIRPDFAKFKQDLVLPDIPKATPIPKEPTPEELVQAQKDKDLYLVAAKGGITNLKGYTGTFKDEDVELNVAYVATDDEKAKVLPIVESLYSSFDYFIDRWRNKDGSMNADLLANDIYLLENRDKILQKQISEAAAQQKKHILKVKGNINVDGKLGQSSGDLQTKTPEQQQIEYLIANG